jgi:large subunit ribosomal protein L10
MRKENKIELVKDLTQKFKENNIFYLLDASGLTVDQVNNFREKCFKQDVEYKVVKNTFIRKALENQEEDFSEIIDGDSLKGFSGLLFASQTPSGPAKVLKEFRKSLDSDHPSLKAASIESDIFLGDDKLDSLSKLKGKEEIIGDIVLLLQSPAKNIISLLKSSENKISGVVKALEDKQE